MNHLHDESTGGPAFPAMEVRTADTQDLVANASQGMTLRDWFAGNAMITMRGAPSDISRWSYEFADAMLAERNKPAVLSIAQTKIDQLREQGFTDYPVVATLQNGMHVCTVDNFGAVRWFSCEQPAVPAGYKLVPIEPTKKMIDAARMFEVGMSDERGDKQGLQDNEAIDIYKVMVGAAHGI